MKDTYDYKLKPMHLHLIAFLTQSQFFKVVRFTHVPDRLSDIITPFIKDVMEIADALNVSIDFLVGKTNLELDSQTISKLEEIKLSLPTS